MATRQATGEAGAFQMTGRTRTQSAQASLALAALVACGGGRAADPPAHAPPTTDDARPAVPVVAGDPLDEASLMADVEWLTAPARKGRGSTSVEAVEVAKWLVDELTAAGYTSTTQPIGEAQGQVNVIATYGPRDDAAATIVVSAHYDHLGEVDGVIYPGADDNASGVAVALAVARDLAAGRVVAGRVIFVFTGAEELGLYGARAYVAAPAWPLADTRAVFNLDMVGRKFFESAGDGIDATLGAVGLDDEPLFAAAATAAAAAGLEVVNVSPAMVALIGEDWRSDDWVFREAGLDAVHFSTGLHPDYHRPGDTVDHLARPQLVRVAHFLRDLVAAVAVTPGATP